MSFLASLIFSKAGSIVTGSAAVLLSILLIGVKLDNARLGRQAKELRADLATADTNLNTCHASLAGANTAIADQNAAWAAKSAEDAASLAKATKALQQARSASVAADRRIAELGKPLKAPEACARAVEARERLLGALQ